MKSFNYPFCQLLKYIILSTADIIRFETIINILIPLESSQKGF